jgi:simple sugar transport system substrate-binding protein
MRKIEKRGHIFLLILLIAAAGCRQPGSPDDTMKVESEHQLRFIFITTCIESRFFDPVTKGMNDAAAMLGVDCSFTGTEGVDLEAQAQMVRQAVQDGYDGIALNIIDPVAFDEVVQEAMDKGIPVVAFNVDDHATPNARLSAVCQQLYDAGRALGKKALDHVPARSHILMTMHAEGVSALEDRLRGAQDILRDKDITWTVAITGNTAAESARSVAHELKADPRIRHILCTGQADTEGAGLAIESSLPGYTAAGFDLSPNTLRLIKAGRVLFTIDQQPYVQGFYPVVQLTHYCRYGILPSDVDSGATVIDKNNVDRVIHLCEQQYR